jgi:hypothetical protein
MFIANLYANKSYWAMVYHTQPNSEEVEFVGVNSMKFFTSKKKAWKWFMRKHQLSDFIQPEAIEVKLNNLILV